MLRFATRGEDSPSERDATRYRRFSRFLSELGAEIAEEIINLGKANERIGACAAFAAEALENGETARDIASSLDTLTVSLVHNSNRIAALHQQRAFLSKVERSMVEYVDKPCLPFCDALDRFHEGDAKPKFGAPTRA